MMRGFIGLGFAVAAGIAVPADAQTARIESRYSKLNNCKLLAAAPLGEDWMFHRCRGHGGIPVWLVFNDSTRSQMGFGAKPNTSGIFGTDRDASWPIEWRGVRRNGRFKPFAVILRLRRPGEHKSFLAVYRLRPDGTSCIIGTTEWSAGSNKAARAIADKAIVAFQCEQQPHLPDLD
jgi:hypothetical protein